MTRDRDPAVCPLCRDVGPIAEPCGDSTCRRFGVCRVPPDYAPDGDRAPDPLVGRMFDDYLVVRRLGAGGVGAVYLALQQPIGLPAAIKLLHADGGPLADPERFRQEAAALARLSHPNIVRLLKYGVAGTTSYLVMEYVEEGRTLESEMRRGLAVADARRILIQMCHGLEAAHRRGVVHRDIKPANVMLQSLPGDEHFVRLVDFGLAKFVDEGHSTRLAAGTPQYMAPEQALKTEIGPWTDGYAVAVIACEMLLGHHPFPGASAQSILLRKCDPAFDPVAALDAPVGPTLAGFLRQALAPAPADRYRDMTALARGLDAVFDERGSNGTLTAALGATTVSETLSAASGQRSGVGPAVAATARRGGGRAALWALSALTGVGLALGGWVLSTAEPRAEATAGAAGAAALGAGAPAVSDETPPIETPPIDTAAAEAGTTADAAPVDAGTPPAADPARQVDAPTGSSDGQRSDQRAAARAPTPSTRADAREATTAEPARDPRAARARRTPRPRPKPRVVSTPTARDTPAAERPAAEPGAAFWQSPAPAPEAKPDPGAAFWNEPAPKGPNEEAR